MNTVLLILYVFKVADKDTVTPIKEFMRFVY